MGDHEYLTLRQAAQFLGINPTRNALDRLRRTLRARETNLGAEILVQVGEGPGARLRVTIATLRRHCPELFSDEDDIYRAISDLSQKLTEEIEDLHVRMSKIEGHFGREPKTAKR
jgi:hypothetical protein